MSATPKVYGHAALGVLAESPSKAHPGGPAPIFGWDVGGAHVKVAVAEAGGALLDVMQWACPLWQGLAHLEQVIDLVLERWPVAGAAHAVHAVTMTGEMVDLFGARAEGVRVLVQTLAQRLGPHLHFYAGAAGWLAPHACAEGWRSVASANWLATGQWVATRLADAILVDIGSTTTDLIPLAGGRVVARAASDAGRLASGELVYQGVVRTPLCGIAHRITFAGQTCNVMNEWFATTADIYRLTGELQAAHDQYPSADQGPKTPAASRVRLARMIGRDAHEASADAWGELAQRWRQIQLNTLAENLAQVCTGHPGLAAAPLVGAGCGRFLAAALARQTARGYVDFGALAAVPQTCAPWAATCAPSVAVALLAAAADFGGSVGGSVGGGASLPLASRAA